MSYQVLFSFSKSFSRDQRVPKGTLKRILDQISTAEQSLGLQRELTFTPENETQRPGWHWHRTKQAMLNHAGAKIDTTIPDWHLLDRRRKELINEMGNNVRHHNSFVLHLYESLNEWQTKKWKRGESEVITVKQSEEFWGGLQQLELPRELWDKDHFTDHMEHLHLLLTTGKSGAVSLDCKPFNPKQASALLNIFESELDQWGYDLRFAIPLDENLKPYDFITTSHDGGYDWCSKCGPILSEAFHYRCQICPHAKKGKCELKNEHPEEFQDE
jgi:hypothetical protein